jgi:hypothetical protein
MISILIAESDSDQKTGDSPKVSIYLVFASEERNILIDHSLFLCSTILICFFNFVLEKIL